MSQDVKSEKEEGREPTVIDAEWRSQHVAGKMSACGVRVSIAVGTRFVIVSRREYDHNVTLLEGDPREFTVADNGLPCLCIGVPTAYMNAAGEHEGANWQVKCLEKLLPGLGKFEVITLRPVVGHFFV